ncbi:MAG TPA: hypothetical protein VE978_26660 [Chitinophagales bacterium]|nr:hypothetical protein [Chitinophagales bacterium]
MSPTEKTDSIETIFKELQDKAKILYPNLLDEINAFNSNQLSLEELERYRSLLNQTPAVISSNHVVA